ncbi:9515_t:CDS:1, partial [Entrophospora sp. SA101]
TFWGRKECKICGGCELKTVNNSKGSIIKLTEEIKETNNELGKRTGY